jgi:hypothetical protein
MQTSEQLQLALPVHVNVAASVSGCVWLCEAVFVAASVCACVWQGVAGFVAVCVATVRMPLPVFLYAFMTDAPQTHGLVHATEGHH